MAVTSADPWAPMRVDCLSVKQGSQKGLACTGAPDRTLAWAPLAAALDDDPRRVVWMPAHCSQDSVGSRKLGNGEGLTKLDITGNALVDQLAKEAARADRLPWARRKRVRELGDIVTAVATWIGQITQLANHFPDPRWDGAGRQPMLRDSEGIAGRQPAKAPHQQRRNSRQAQAHTLGSMQAELGHPRMEAIARRVRAKEVASHVDRGAEPDNRNSNLPSAWVESLPLRSLQLPRAGGRQKPAHDQRWPYSWLQRAPGLADAFDAAGAQAAPCQPGQPHSMAVGAAGAASPTPVLEELQELERCGLRVRLPDCASASASSSRIQAAGMGASKIVSRDLQFEQPSSEEHAALAELAALEQCGLRVTWPR